MINFLLGLVILASIGAGIFLGWTECERIWHKLLHSFGKGLAGLGIGLIIWVLVLVILSAPCFLMMFLLSL